MPSRCLPPSNQKVETAGGLMNAGRIITYMCALVLLVEIGCDKADTPRSSNSGTASNSGGGIASYFSSSKTADPAESFKAFAPKFVSAAQEAFAKDKPWEEDTGGSMSKRNLGVYTKHEI